jgi:hypothetical protein
MAGWLHAGVAVTGSASGRPSGGSNPDFAKKAWVRPERGGMSKWPFTTLHLPVTVTATRPDIKATAHLDRATSPLAAPPRRASVGSGPSSSDRGEVPPARRAGLIMMHVPFVRSLVRFAPIVRPHLRFGTALIAYHRTGIIPAHLLTRRLGLGLRVGQRTRAQHGPTVLHWYPRGDGASRS